MSYKVKSDLEVTPTRLTDMITRMCHPKSGILLI